MSPIAQLVWTGLIAFVPAGSPEVASQQEESAQVAQDEHLLTRAGMAVDGAGLLDFFRSQTATPAEQLKIARMIQCLGDKSFRARDRASRALQVVGPKALPQLRRRRNSAGLETMVRADECIRRIEAQGWSSLQAAATRLAAHRHPKGVVEVMMAFVPFAADATVVEGVHTALVRLGVTCEADRKALRECLNSQLAAQRSVAALVLGRHGNAADADAVRKLLVDPDGMVRFRAAQGLLGRGDTPVLSVLVSLLAEGGSLGQRVEDLLRQLAGDDAPAIYLESNPAGRARCRQAWAAWGQSHQGHLEVGRIDPARPAHTSCRARAVAIQFLNALSRGDFGAALKTTEPPFHLAGALVLQTEQELDELFQGVMAENRKRHEEYLSFTLVKVLRLEDYLVTSRGLERELLSRLPAAEVRVVYVHARMGHNPPEDGALLVRVHGGRARVIGICPPVNKIED
jgi:hypothetical protein